MKNILLFIIFTLAFVIACNHENESIDMNAMNMAYTAGNADQNQSLCQSTCSSLGDCSISVCTGFTSNDIPNLIDACTPVCQEQPEFASEFKRQMTCEDKVSLYTKSVPEFASICKAEDILNDCTTICQRLLNLMKTCCSPNDFSDAITTCEMSCTSNNVSMLSASVSCEDIATFGICP